MTQVAVWVWVLVTLQALWSLISLAAVRQMQKTVDKAKDDNRETAWQLENAKERLERLRLKGILTPETRLGLHERRAEPMPKQVSAPATPDEAARILGALWDVLHLVEEGAPQEDLVQRLRETLGQEERP